MKMMLIHTIDWHPAGHTAGAVLPQLILCSGKDCDDAFDRQCTAFYEIKKQTSCHAIACIIERFEI